MNNQNINYSNENNDDNKSVDPNQYLNRLISSEGIYKEDFQPPIGCHIFIDKMDFEP